MSVVQDDRRRRQYVARALVKKVPLEFDATRYSDTQLLLMVTDALTIAMEKCCQLGHVDHGVMMAKAYEAAHEMGVREAKHVQLSMFS